jgi:hypothetical protein
MYRLTELINAPSNIIIPPSHKTLIYGKTMAFMIMKSSEPELSLTANESVSV